MDFKFVLKKDPQIICVMIEDYDNNNFDHIFTLISSINMCHFNRFYLHMLFRFCDILFKIFIYFEIYKLN